MFEKFEFLSKFHRNPESTDNTETRKPGADESDKSNCQGLGDVHYTDGVPTEIAVMMPLSNNKTGANKQAISSTELRDSIPPEIATMIPLSKFPER